MKNVRSSQANFMCSVCAVHRREVCTCLLLVNASPLPVSEVMIQYRQAVLPRYRRHSSCATACELFFRLRWALWQRHVRSVRAFVCLLLRRDANQSIHARCAAVVLGVKAVKVLVSLAQKYTVLRSVPGISVANRVFLCSTPIENLYQTGFWNSAPYTYRFFQKFLHHFRYFYRWGESRERLKSCICEYIWHWCHEYKFWAAFIFL